MRKRTTLLWPVFGLSLLFTVASCSNDQGIMETSEAIDLAGSTTTENTMFFPVDDGSKVLTGSGEAAKLSALMRKVKPDMALNLGSINITQGQYDIIKDYVERELAAEGDPAATYKNIFGWVTSNVKFGVGSPDPYEVFTQKVSVCQGYANLLRVMLHTQGIPCAGVNGMLSTIGGHAWCCAYVGTRWVMSDPTNGGSYVMTDLASYQNTLIPSFVDIPLVEDESFACTFKDAQYTVSEVKKCEGDYLTVPFSVGGIQVTSFCPDSIMPENIKVLYVGKNIRTLGDAYLSLNSLGPNVEYVYVDEDNRYLSSYEGVVYKKTGKTPYYIPQNIKRVVLKAMTTVGKNVILNLPNVEEIVFAEGTKTIEAYAIEHCPNLKRVYVPESVTSFADNAIYDCNDDVEVITVPTGIHDVVM